MWYDPIDLLTPLQRVMYATLAALLIALLLLAAGP